MLVAAASVGVQLMQRLEEEVRAEEGPFNERADVCIVTMHVMQISRPCRMSWSRLSLLTWLKPWTKYGWAPVSWLLTFDYCDVARSWMPSPTRANSPSPKLSHCNCSSSAQTVADVRCSPGCVLFAASTIGD